MPSLDTTHPLKRMAVRLAHASDVRDVRVLNAWLCGQELPRLTQQGEWPYEVLWQAIYEWWQPDPEALEALQQLVCDALDACAEVVKSQGLAQAQAIGADSSMGMSSLQSEFGVPAKNGEDWTSYCQNLFSLCAQLPQHVGTFD